MSDHEHDPSEMFREILGLPDKETVQREKMHATAETHEIYNWFNTVDQESLQRIKTIVGSVINASNGHSGAAMQAAFWQGFIVAKLEDNHSVCPACGVNHMDELALDDETER